MKISFAVKSHRFIVSIALILLSGSPCLAQDFPDAAAIETLSKDTQDIYNSFLFDTIDIRLAYSFHRSFQSESDKQKLYAGASAAVGQLEKIIDTQARITDRIEQYPHSDWDIRFGSTGLWRTAVNTLNHSRLLKTSILYYQYLCSDRSLIERDIFSIVSALNQLTDSVDASRIKFSKARLLSLLNSDSKYKDVSLALLGSAVSNVGIVDEVYFGSAIFKLEISDDYTLEDVRSIYADLKRSRWVNDIEFNIRLTFLALRLGDDELLESTVQKWPQAKPFIAQLLLHKIEKNIKDEPLSAVLDGFSSFQTDLICIHTNPAEPGFSELLAELSAIEKFRTSAVLYTRAINIQKESPALAVKLLMEAGEKQKQAENPVLDKSAENIARFAVELAYQLYVDDANNCDLTAAAFENFFEVADKTSDEFKYLYSTVLKSCRRQQQYLKTLRQLAHDHLSNFSEPASIELVIYDLQNTTDKAGQKELLQYLADLLLSVSRKDKLALMNPAVIFQAIEFLADSGRPDIMQRALQILDYTDYQNTEQFLLLKCRLYRLLNRPDDVVETLIIFDDNSRLCSFTLSFLTDVLLEIETCQDTVKDYSRFINNCFLLSSGIIDCAPDASKLAGQIVNLEFEVILNSYRAADKSHLAERIDNLTALLGSDNIDIVRIKARYSMVQGQFADAARLWAKLAAAHNSVNSQSKSWHWFRAKYYQIYCLEKSTPADSEKIIHAIDVIVHSSEDIPLFWQKKFTKMRSELICT